MKPSKLTIIIWTIIALLGVISYIVPQGGWTVGNWSFRWPTLNDMLQGNSSSKPDSLLTSQLMQMDTIVVIDSTAISPDTIQKQQITSSSIPVQVP